MHAPAQVRDAADPRVLRDDAPRPITSGRRCWSVSITRDSAHLMKASGESFTGCLRSALRSSTSMVWPSIAATAAT